MTEEQQERLKQIRELRNRNTRLSFDYTNALCEGIDFLLSLLDSQEQVMGGLTQETAENIASITIGKIKPDAYKALVEMIGTAIEDKATTTRSRCVDAIKTLRSTPRGAAYSNAINDAIHKVESLPLEQGEQEP